MPLTEHCDIAVTWPKGRSLSSYLGELGRAFDRREVVNFRLPARPKSEPERCYMVHDGKVRGWTRVLGVVWREEGTVRNPITGDWWPWGWYVVRDPQWFALPVPAPMRGFQGFRYVDRDALRRGALR